MAHYLIMNGKIEDQNFRLDGLKWSLFWLLFFIGVGANFYYAKVALSLRLIVWLALVAVLISIAFYTRLGRKGWEFAQEARAEMRKVVWPTRDETVKVTMVVVAMVVVVALILWGIDSVLLWIMGWLTGQRG